MGKKFGLLMLYFGIVPLGLSLLQFAFMGGAMDHLMFASLLPLIIGGFLVGLIALKKLKETGILRDRFVLFLLPLAYTAVLWAVFMLISGGFYGHNAWLFFFHFSYSASTDLFYCLING